MLNGKGLVHIGSISNIDIYEYIPQLFRWHFHNIEPMTLKRWVRYLLEYITGGYKVYYLAVEDIIVSQAVFAPGGRLKRLYCATVKDYIVGPTYTMPANRGRGYSKFLLSNVISMKYTQVSRLFSYIRKDNKASLSVFLKIGFAYIGEVKSIGLLSYRIVSGDTCPYHLLEYKNSNRGIPWQ